MTWALRNISVQKGSRKILNGVDMICEVGKVTAIIGPNGAGKSTLLRVLCGIEKISSGECDRGGSLFIPYLAPEQETAFDFEVGQILLMGRYFFHRGFPTKKDEEICKAELSLLGMSDLWDRSFLSLSSGERQIVRCARTLSAEQKLVCLDEPFSHLDWKHQLQLRRRILDLNHTQQSSFLLVHHDMRACLEIAERYYFLKNGTLIGACASEDSGIEGFLSETFEIHKSEISSILGGKN